MEEERTGTRESGVRGEERELLLLKSRNCSFMSEQGKEVQEGRRNSQNSLLCPLRNCSLKCLGLGSDRLMFVLWAHRCPWVIQDHRLLAQSSKDGFAGNSLWPFSLLLEGQ